MKIKTTFLAALLCALSTNVSAGIDWIDTSTGDFQCSNGYKGTNNYCYERGSSWTGMDWCRKTTSQICN